MWPDFGLAWRFTDAKFSMLNTDELSRIRPIAPAASERSWRELFDGAMHLLERPRDTISPLDQAWILTDDKLAAAAQIRKWDRSWLMSACVFYWSPSCAAMTDMGLVISRFDDFCYSSDDNIVIIFENSPRIITWCEGNCLLEYVQSEKVAAAWKWATA